MGFGGGTSTFGGRGGGFSSRTRPARNSTPGSWGGGGGGSAGPAVTKAGPQVTQAGPRVTQAGPRRSSAGPQMSYRSSGPVSPSSPSLPSASPMKVSAPKPTANTNISVGAERNPQLDSLLNQQQQNIQSLKDNTGFAADVAALRTADSFEGARNAAQYLGGEGRSGVRQTRQDQITDRQLAAQGRQQADLALGREAMVTGAIQGQLPTIMGQQSGMLGQQGIGLQAEGLRQQAGRDQFNQGLAGQRFATDVGFRNQDNAFRSADQQLRALQGTQGLYGGPWGPTGWGGGY